MMEADLLVEGQEVWEEWMWQSVEGTRQWKGVVEGNGEGSNEGKLG